MIILENVSICDKSGNVRFNHFNLEFPDKGMVSLIGLSSSDTIQIFELLEGKTKPSEGKVIWNGKDIANKENTDSDSDCFTKGQAIPLYRGLDFPASFSALESVEFNLLVQNETKVKEKALTALEAVGLDWQKGTRIWQLSEEEQYKVKLARALSGKQSVVFADDPYSHLPEESAKEILALLYSISQKKLVILSCKEPVTSFSNCQSIIFKNNQIVSNTLSHSLKQVETKLQNHNLNTVKKGLRLGNLIQLAKRSLRIHPLFFAFTILISGIALALCGTYAALASYKEADRIADNIYKEKDDYLSLENCYHENGNKDHIAFQGFSEETASALVKKLGCPALKVAKRYDTGIKFNGMEIFEYQTGSDSLSIRDFYNYPGRSGITRYTSLDSLGSLPMDYRILTGRRPSNDNEVRITDFHFDEIKEIGSQYNQSYKDLSYDLVVGKPLSICRGETQIITNLKIVGILDTDYAEQDFALYKKYCESGAGIQDEIPEDSEIKKEEGKLSARKRHSYLNLFFVSPNVLEKLKSTTTVRPGKYSLLLDNEKVLERSYLADIATRINYLSDKTKNRITLFKGSSFDEEDFISRDLSSYIMTIGETEGLKAISGITIPKRFLPKSATEDYLYPGNAYDFFLEFFRFPIEFYAIDNYNSAYMNNEFDLSYYSKKYYLSLGKETPMVIPDEDKLPIYKAYLTDYVLSGYPDYSSPYTSQAFLSITSSAKNMLSYYRNLYSDSIFRKNKKVTYIITGTKAEENKKVRFTLCGLTLPMNNFEYYSPVRKKEGILRIYPDGCEVYESVLVPSQSDREKIKRIADFKDSFYTDNFSIALNNPSADVAKTIDKRSSVREIILISFLLSSTLAIILQFVFLLARVLSSFLSDSIREKKLGVRNKDISKEAFLILLAAPILSLPLSIVFRYITLCILKACLAASGYPLFIAISPGYTSFLFILALCLFISILTSVSFLWKRKKLTIYINRQEN